MVEIASDRPLFKTILVEMAYFVIHLHNRVNKSKIVVLLLCPEELELGKHLRCLPRCDHWKLLAVVVIVIVCGQQRWLELFDDSLCNVISATFCKVQLRFVSCISSLGQSVKCVGGTILRLQAGSKKKCWTSDFFTLFFCQKRVALMIKNAKKMGKNSSLQLQNPAPHSYKLSHNL